MKMDLENAFYTVATAMSWVGAFIFFLFLFSTVILGLILLTLKVGRWFTVRIKHAWEESEQDILNKKFFKPMEEQTQRGER
jgi:hypothetical protein